MSFFVTKTIIGWLFFVFGIVAVTSMLSIMGRQDHKIPAPRLRKIHRSAGILFFLLMLANAVLGFRFWIINGDTLSTRAVLHAVLGLGLVVVLGLKVTIIRTYKSLLRYAPTMGMIVFGLGFITFLMSGGYFTGRSLAGGTASSSLSEIVELEIKGDPEQGASLFDAQCGSCHFSDKMDARFGPGLLNLLKNETLPSSNRPATVENVRNQIVQPYRSMPAFTGFSEKEMTDLLAYLKSL
jgi:cytochrome c2